MGKHDSDEGMGFFLGGAENVKNGAFWLKDNLKLIGIIALIPIIGFIIFSIKTFFANLSAYFETAIKAPSPATARATSLL